MIESGSHPPGVESADFDLPAGTALRYDRAAAALADVHTHDLGAAAAHAGIDTRVLLRPTRRYLGFPPEILLMRTRFLRAFTAMLIRPGTPDFAAIPAAIKL